MTRDDYMLLGSIVKTRGIAGEVVIRLNIPAGGIKNNLKSLMIKIDGLLVPFFIISWHLLNEKEILAVFRDINTKKKAEFLKDRDVFIQRVNISTKALRPDIQSLSGYLVEDIHLGEIGKATGILEVPGNDLLKIYNLGSEILLPVREGLILEIDSKRKIIIVDIPEGLMDI